MNTLKNCCYILGTALLLAALFLTVHNFYEDKQGGRQAEAVLSVLREKIPDAPAENAPETTAPLPDEYDPRIETAETAAPEMPEAEADGRNYIGYLSVPALELELPVAAEVSDAALKISPCRYSGSIYEDNLIIAAHNYSRHFGRIGTLSVGAELIFTDMKGAQYRFAVCDIEQLPGTAVAEMQGGSDSDWDLTLFTCTLNGQSRVTVRAVRES